MTKAAALAKTAAVYPYADRVLTDTVPCRGCGAPIHFGKTTAGKLVPLDPVPTPAGNYVRNRHRAKRSPGVRADSFAVVRLDEAVTGPRYLSHYATCPHRDDFRKEGGEG